MLPRQTTPPQKLIRPGSRGPILAPVMFNDPIFERHRHEVWPLFWPVFVLAIRLFNWQAEALLAEGCLSIGYEVSSLGLIRITDTVFPGAPAGWKDSLFSATGAYEGGRAPLFPGLPAPDPDPGTRDLPHQGADPDPATLDPNAVRTGPALLRIARISWLNCVFLRRAERQTRAMPAAHNSANLPLPHT